MEQVAQNLSVLAAYGIFICVAAYIVVSFFVAVGMTIGKGIAASLDAHIKDSFNQNGDNNEMNINLYFGREK